MKQHYGTTVVLYHPPLESFVCNGQDRPLKLTTSLIATRLKNVLLNCATALGPRLQLPKLRVYGKLLKSPVLEARVYYTTPQSPKPLLYLREPSNQGDTPWPAL